MSRDPFPFSPGTRGLARARRAFRCVVVLSATGCAPMLGHGPAVHPGLSFGGSASLGTGPTYANGDDPGPFFLGAGMMHAAYGWRPASGHRPALRVGVQGPVEGTVGADVYLQAPRAWLGPATGGAGVLVDGRRVMPYVQLGVQDARGFGTHAMIGRYDEGRRRYIGYWSHQRASVTWLSLQLPASDWATVHLQGGLAHGHVTRQMTYSATPYVDEDRWVNLGGLTLELHRPRR